MITLYHNNRCSKSRQTLELLREKGQKVEVVEYLKTTPTKDDLRAIVAKLGIGPEELLRKGEAVYKELYAGKQLDDDAWLDAMVAHPELIERPIVVHGNKAVIGRPPEKVLSVL